MCRKVRLLTGNTRKINPLPAGSNPHRAFFTNTKKVAKRQPFFVGELGGIIPLCYIHCSHRLKSRPASFRPPFVCSQTRFPRVQILTSLFSPTQKRSLYGDLSLLVSSVGLFRYATFTALIGLKADRRPSVRLSFVVKPASRGFKSSPRFFTNTKKAAKRRPFLVGELGGIRTRDPLIKSQMLYRLSYELAKTDTLIKDKKY